MAERENRIAVLIDCFFDLVAILAMLLVIILPQRFTVRGTNKKANGKN